MLLLLPRDPVAVDDTRDAGDTRVVPASEAETLRLPLLRGSAPTAEERLDARGGETVVPDGVERGFTPGEAEVVGRVVGPDGASLRGAVVRAFVDGPGGEREELGGVGTAALGRFWLRLARPEERVHIEIVPPAYAEEPYAPTVVRDVATGAADQVLALRPGVWLEGEIVDSKGAPIAGAQVVHWPDGEAAHEARRTETDGRFRVAVAPGTHHVFADPRARGLTCTPARVVRVPTSPLRLVCPTGVTVRGRLVGEDAAGFLVGWSRVTADGAGRSGAVRADGAEALFELANVPSETVTLYAWRTGDGRYALRRVDATADVRHELTLEPGLAIEGVLVAPSSPGRIRYLNAWDRQLKVWRLQRVEGDGTFRLRGLPPGRYDLIVAGVARANGVAAGSTGVRLEVPPAER